MSSLVLFDTVVRGFRSLGKAVSRLEIGTRIPWLRWDSARDEDLVALRGCPWWSWVPGAVWDLVRGIGLAWRESDAETVVTSAARLISDGWDTAATWQ